MSENTKPSQSGVVDDEIDLRELFAAIWQGKWIIIAVTAVFAVVSVFYALSLPNIYKSEVLLAPAGEQQAAPALPGSRKIPLPPGRSPAGWRLLLPNR